MAQSGDEPTLPPVVVRPGGEGPATSTPRRYAPNPYDLPDSYPGLSEQILGEDDGTGLDSALRGEKSIFDSPASATILNRDQLDQKQPTDMFRALEKEVGVLMQQTARGQASPFVRGLTGQQVLILVDGVRMNNSTYRAGPNQYFNLIDPGQIERVEIVRGPQSVLWGSDALGGVINVVTRSASPLDGDYWEGSFVEYLSSADTGSYSRGNLEGWVGQSGVFAGASYLNVNDLDRGGDLGRQPFTNYDQYAGDIKYNTMLGPDDLLTVALQHFEQQDLPRSDRFPPFVFGPPANAPRPTFIDPQQRDLVYLRLQGLGSSALFDAYTTTLSYQRNREGSSELRPELNPDRLELSEFDVDTFGYTLAFSKDWDYLGRLTYGADWYHDELDAFRNRVSGSGSGPQNPQFPSDGRYDRAGTFANWDVPVTERLNAVVGVRYETVAASGTIREVTAPQEFDRTYDDVIGSLGLVYELNPCMNLVGGVSQGFRAPNLDDLAADNPVLQNAQDVPSIDVDPEHSTNYEIGLKMDFERIRLQATEFWTEIDDNILRQAVNAQGQPVPNTIGPNGVPVPGSGNFLRDNFDVYINGTELAGELLLEQGWSVYGNFWYIYGQDLEREEPLSRIPPTQGVLGLRWRDEHNRRWFDTYTWLVRHQDRYAVQNNIDSRFPLGGTPGYGTLNMRMGTTLGRCCNHHVSLSLENITDKAYRVLGSGVDGAGFNAILGYEWVH